MDPFAPDSDPEEGAGHPLSANQKLSRHSRLSSRSSINVDVTKIKEALLDDEDDEPPPSILLASPKMHTPGNTSDATGTLAYNGVALNQSSNAEAGPSQLRESVRLGGIDRLGNTAGLYEDNDNSGDDEDELRGLEEQAELLKEPQKSSSSSSSSSSRRRERGVFHKLARKVRRRAAKIQAENSMLGGANRRKTGASGLDPRERALWEWGTRENMDEFLQEVS